MKKISYLELASLIIIEVVTMFSGISITILKEGAFSAMSIDTNCIESNEVV